MKMTTYKRRQLKQALKVLRRNKEKREILKEQQRYHKIAIVCIILIPMIAIVVKTLLG